MIVMPLHFGIVLVERQKLKMIHMKNIDKLMMYIYNSLYNNIYI